ncbi:Carboxylesterase NlhH [Phialemonium atrogriseum]|uniref:Carboxylesterase NlhH n=1 Tax=Phialemonium atrogriseum TaxID=1093897 RepID=A0AAJ0FHG9_9PEZI|nr:Carboxylesterase NlhH [Phialemonium atrogriseum]KAK1762164.1 Carboxylesterase NlhH [Phialemonium atrogriseum]
MARLPSTPDEILASSRFDPDFEATWKAQGSPSGDPPCDIPTLKSIMEKHFPSIQQKATACRPAGVVQAEYLIPLETGFESRTLVCHAARDVEKTRDKLSPIVVLFHGGGNCIGYPELELDLAYQLVLTHNATVICPSVRQAPEHPFPASINDAWAILQYIGTQAGRSADKQSGPSLLPPNASASAGFIVGGSSSGAHTSGVLARLYLDEEPSPPLTGQFLSCGAYVNPSGVPAKFREVYLSREQNADAPVLTQRFLRLFQDAEKPDTGSRLWSPMWDYPDCLGLMKTKMPPAYFQACGLDLSRDDSLIYERVLREECGVPTKMDLYSGFPHCFWNSFPEMEASKKRLKDSVEGIGWLLGRIGANASG